MTRAGNAVAVDGAAGCTGSAALRILLVEGHADTARVMARLLACGGHTVAVAHGVREALDAASAGDFDVLVTEVHLPDGTGPSLLRRLRPMPGIALACHFTPEDEDEAHAAGFAALLTKPLRFVQLEAAIGRAVAGPD